MKNTFILTAICLFFSFAAFAGAPPVVEFVANKFTAVVGESVEFTDLTDGSNCGTPNAWTWNFGVGASSGMENVQNPTVVYNTPGLKTISLGVGFTGCGTTVSNGARDNYIEILAEPVSQNLPVLNRTRLFLFGTLIFGVAVLVMVRMNGRS